MSAINPLLIAITDRVDAIIAKLDAGQDCPPADQLRLEGLMQAAVLLGIASEVELQNLFEQRYQDLTDHCIKTHFGDNWTDFFQFPCLPLFAKPAPVKPTTKT